MNTIKMERSKATNRWVKSTKSSGTCFTISFDRFEEILRTGKIPAAFSNWKLKNGEAVERFEMSEQGVTVFIGNCQDSSVQRGR